jgi:hypothetical protein
MMVRSNLEVPWKEGKEDNEGRNTKDGRKIKEEKKGRKLKGKT